MGVLIRAYRSQAQQGTERRGSGEAVSRVIADKGRRSRGCRGKGI